MTKHVIVGAGLGGLYTANRLLNNGVNPENIVIIDPRSGLYTRPGHLSHQTFKLVNRHTRVNTDNHSSAHHIKELERIMYNELITKGVTFVNEPFIKLQQQSEEQPKAVITQKDDGSHGIYPADFVFDCTGKDAHVACSVNSYLESNGLESAFKSKPLVEINPIPDHLVAQVIIPEHYSLIDFIGNEATVPLNFKRFSSQKNIEAREKLQSLGWPYQAFPSFYTYPQSGTNKVCLYMEAPPDLPKEQQHAWIKLLLNIYSYGLVTDYSELKPSQKYDEKPRVLAFKSKPHLLNKVVFQSNDLPVVIVGFDAFKGFDYRLANGVNSGISCFELMMRHINIDDGRIQSIDSDAIEHDLFEYVNNQYKNRLVTLLSTRQTAIEHGYEYFSDRYNDAVEDLLQPSGVKKKLFQSISGELAYQGALARFSKLGSRDKSTVTSLETLNNCLSLLIKASRRMPPSDTIAHHDTNAKLKSIINDIRLEIAALNSEQIVMRDRDNNARVKTLFESIKNNFEQLQGTFSNRAIQNKASEIIERIDQMSASSSSFLGSGATGELNSISDLLFPLLFSSITRRSSVGSEAFSFFRPLTQQRTGIQLLSLFIIEDLFKRFNISDEDNDREPNFSFRN